MLGLRKMRVKLRRGPRPGYTEIPEYSQIVMCSRPREITFEVEEDPLTETFVHGHYQRTNIMTKSGVPVFEWMGWKGEVSG
jgi:hypothetical protein